MLKTFTALAVLSAWPVAAQQCKPVAADEAQARQAGFETVVTGNAASGLQFVIRANKAGTWVALVVRPDGLACYLIQGASLFTLPVGEPA